MKYSVKLLYLTILTVILGGCSKDFIALSPISNANEQDFYKTEADYVNAIYGTYSTLKTNGVYNDYMQLVGDLRSDNTEMGSTASTRFPFFELSEFKVQSTSPIVESIWNDNYSGIRRANAILDRIDGADISSETKSRIGGEAKFLRGLFYFNLVRVFGKVPLVTKSIQTIEESYSFGRTETPLVYNQIVQDLTAAEAVLPTSVAGEEGRATKGAADALLGKVYLTIHDYPNARDVLKKVITSNLYELLPDYNDLWKATNKNNKESIFDVQFMSSITNDTGAPFTERYTPYLYPFLPFSSTAGGYNIPRADLISAYEVGDLRKAASLKESYVNTNGNVVSGLDGRFNVKFHDTPVKNGGSNDNWPVLRYADVILMYAEALNEVSFQPGGEAFTMLNKIRKRAGLLDKSADNSDPKLIVNSQQAFRLAIEQERRVELAFEGHRWFDLVRTGRAIEELGPKFSGGINESQLLLPIPLSQIDVNPQKITQNPGY